MPDTEVLIETDHYVVWYKFRGEAAQCETGLTKEAAKALAVRKIAEGFSMRRGRESE